METEPNPKWYHELEPRNEGCRAPLYDRGMEAERHIPVCMGGIAIIGCNNAEECTLTMRQREQLDNGHTTVPYVRGGYVIDVDEIPTRLL